ncbi:redoxin domain-containing protein [Rubinisphaera margarita]|uniref:redoxin domain-containing protein n=1 Tax=Rubinisphaera margarita TaxID=2909586 RepID=UPI001EE797F7|nr:redoxin domain-containing protein [Rubinisphaera margarita]MCG6154803.1 redoxin domain-containing protein [Rubinisphaera margarita]
MKKAIFSSLSVFMGVLLVSVATFADEARSGTAIHNFVLRDQDGLTRSLAGVESRAVVVVFLGTECPLAKLYSGRLQAMADEYNGERLTVLGIMSNQHDSVDNIGEYAEKHQLTFPLLKDVHNRVADQFEAERTPEAFLLDEERTVVYRGRIDDQFGVGTYRDEPRNHDLKDALDDLLAGRDIRTSRTEAVGCIIGREPKPKSSSAITFSNQIVRLFQQRCIDCHREGQVAPFALTDYDEVAGWAGMIEEVVREGRMPPWHAAAGHAEFANNCSLTVDEKELIFQWVAAGAPEGDPTEMPVMKQYPSEWLLPREPDVIIPVTKEPVQVPANGTVKYQYYSVDPGFTEDKWIQAAEVRPSNALVVHHVLVFARDRESKERGGGEEGGFLAAYVPGLIPQPYPAGMAKKIPANSELVFQMHYTPIGSATEDQSELALIFADREEITHQIVTSSATNRNFEIPPGDGNYEVSASSPRAQADVQLLTMMPHMHLRGKAFRYELQTPDGKRQTLLDVPAYDFNWQTSYRLAEPLTIEAGSQLFCTAHFDNSEDNPFNPDPGKTVRWGDQTWEEMMIGYFDLAVPIDGRKSVASALGGRADQLIARLDADGDGKISRKEVPTKWLAIFLLIDADRDGFVDAGELEAAARKQGRN